jgi:hypothetical protein
LRREAAAVARSGRGETKREESDGVITLRSVRVQA